MTIPSEETGAVIPLEQAQAEGITEGTATSSDPYANEYDSFDWDAYWANYNWGDYSQSYNNDEAGSYAQEEYPQEEYTETVDRPVEAAYDEVY